MSSLSVQFFVPGKPETAGSKRAFVVAGRAVVTETGDAASKRRKASWRGDLKDAAAKAANVRSGGTWAPDGLPLSVTFVEVRKRPASHLTTGKDAGVVKDWAIELQPVGRPDALKIARAAEDALTGVLWPDDAQIVHEIIWKAYGDQVGLTPRAEGLIANIKICGGYSGPGIDMLSFGVYPELLEEPA